MRTGFEKIVAAAAMLVVAEGLFNGTGLRALGEYARPASGGANQQAAAASNRKQGLDAKAQFEKGQEALQDGDLDAAEAAFRQVLAVDSRSAGAYSNLGVIAMRRKDWEKALTLLLKAEKIDPH